MKINTNRLCRASICLLFLSFRCVGQPPSFSEATAAPAQPPELHLVLTTKEGRTQFHLGEIIALDLAYSSSSSAPDKYLWVSSPQRIKGHAATLEILPGGHVIDRSKDTGMKNIYSILHANCGVGFGGGVGGGCGDCNYELQLAGSPIHFPYSLSPQFQITEPGHYVIKAESDDVILAPLRVEASKPIKLTSNSLEIEVIEDPVWSENELKTAITRFENARAEYVKHGWNSISMNSMDKRQIPARLGLQREMQSSAQAMRVLDTESSLREVVQIYNPFEPDSGFYTDVLWQAIVQSKHRSLAINLLSQRITDPDFAVSKDVLDQLIAMELVNQIPDAFSRDDDEFLRELYPSARQILEEHILALGDSLPNKNAEALRLSLETFKIYSSEHFCTDEPLIPNATSRQILKGIKALDAEPQ